MEGRGRLKMRPVHSLRLLPKRVIMRQPIKKGRYYSYLLRLWETTDGNLPVWRAMLELPATGEKRSFASLDELFVYLMCETSPEKLASLPPKPPVQPED